MYAYFHNTATGGQVKTQVLRTIRSKLRSQHIEGRNYEYTSPTQLANFVVDATTAGARNLVAIGNDVDFHQLLHASKDIDGLTFGYVPLFKTSNLAKLLDIGSHKQACEALTARKVISIATISIDGSPVVTQTELSHDDNVELRLHIDNKLELKLEAHQLKLQNLQTDAHNSRAIGLEVFALPTNIKLHPQKPILKLAHSSTPTIPCDHQLLHLTADRVEIRSNKPLQFGATTETKASYLIRITPHPLQIIAKKHAQLNPS